MVRLQPGVPTSTDWSAAHVDDQAVQWGALIQLDCPCKRQLLWDTMAPAEPRPKAIEFRLVATAVELSGDPELQPANLDGRASILPTLPRLAALGFQGDLPGGSGFKGAPITASPIYNISAALSAVPGHDGGAGRARQDRRCWWPLRVEPRHSPRRVMCFRTATCRKNSCLGWAGLPTRAAPAGTSDITPACAPILAPCPMRMCPAMAACPPT
jgi:hypothetical protein